MKRFTSIFLAVIISKMVYAQPPSVGNWLIYFGNQKISSRFNFHNEIQYRNYNFIGDMNQLLIRTGIGYNINKNNNILLGYGYIQSYVYDSTLENKSHTNEHRIFQQFIIKKTIKNYYFNHRLRFEERFINSAIKYRFRYFLSINKPLNKKTMEDHTIYASMYNEIFLNTNNQFFDRNRIYAGIGFAFKKDLRLEAGYMIQSLKLQQQQQFQIILFNNLSL